MKAIMLSIDPHEVVNIADKNYIMKLIRKTAPKISTPFKVFLYCRNVLPYVVWGNVFKGNWETELTTLYSLPFSITLARTLSQREV